MPANTVEVVLTAKDEASKKLANVSKGFGSMQLVAVASFIAIAKEALKAGKALLDFALKGTVLADKIGDMSAKLGVSTETMSTLGFAAEQTGSSLEAMETGVRTLSRQVVMAAEGSKRYADIFENLGVQITDTSGAVRPIGELLEGIADGMENVASETEKAGIMQMLFGSTGTDMILVMEGGAAAMEDWEKRARQLGIVIEMEAAAKADKFQDSLAQLNSAITGLSLAIGTTLLPPLTSVITLMANLTGEIAKMVSGSDKAVEAGEAMAQMLKLILRWGVGAYEIVGKLVVVMIALAKAKAFPLEAVQILKDATESYKEVTASADRLRAVLDADTDATRSNAEAKATATDEIILNMERQGEAHWALNNIQAETFAEAKVREAERAAEADAKAAAAAAPWIAAAEDTADVVLAMAEVQTRSDASLGQQRKKIAEAAGKAILKKTIDTEMSKALATQVAEVGKALMQGPLTAGASLLAIPVILAAWAGLRAGLAGVKLQKGGVVTGGVPGHDSVPALLEPGELVLPRRVTEHIRGLLSGQTGAGAMQAGGVAGLDGPAQIGPIFIDSLSDYQYIDRLVERLNEAVMLRGLRLVATEVRGET